MSVQRCGLLAFAAVAVVTLSGIAKADPLAVANFSFEDPDAAGSYVVGLPTDWLDNGASGPFVEDCGAVGFSGCDGAQYGGLDGGEIYQDLGVPFAPYTKYTVDVATAHRSGFTHGTLEFGLYDSGAIGTELATAGFADIQGVWSGSGNPDGDDMFNVMRDASALAAIGSGALGQPFTFTTGATAPGGNVAVFLRSPGGARVDFENVRVDATEIPEPATGALVVIGCGLVGAMLRRR